MAASSPTCARFIPAAANTSGKSPQAIPSFRLLTSPAWLTLDRFAVDQRGAPEDLARRGDAVGRERPEERGFVRDVMTGFADEECGQREPHERRIRRRDRTAAGGGRSVRQSSPWRARWRRPPRIRRTRSTPSPARAVVEPTRSIFMMTVVDHVRPWLTPSRRFANRIQFQLGAHIRRNGTGTATSHPATSTCLRPRRSDSRPAP